MLELLSPAGSPEAVIAAVQNGADAIYMGMGDFNARRGAKNFSDEEFEKAMGYCRIRGCKVYVTLNTLVADREMEAAVAAARLASRCGADGARKTQILNDQPVGPQGGGKARVLHGSFHLPVVYEGVQRHIHLAAPDSAVAHGLFKFLICEVFRAAAGVKVAHTQIYGVGPVLYRGNHSLRRACGREQLYHSLYSS